MELEQAIQLLQHKNIPSDEKTSWADLGCGSGLFTNAIAHLIAPESTVYAVDKNRSGLEKIILPPSVSLKKMVADFEKEELSLSQLDGIIMANSLHFVKEKNSILQKIKNYLKPEGIILLVEYDMDVSNPWVPFPASFKTAQALFLKTGFHSFEKIYELPSRYNRANIYSAFISQ